MTTILTKKKDTSGAPAPGDLTNAAGGAELAVNTADKRLYTKNSGGNVVEIGTNPTILNIDNIQIDGSTISSTNTNGDINITPNGTGSVVVSKLNVTGAMTFDGNVTVGNSSADTLVVNSTITSNLIFTDNTYDIGASGATRPRSLFLGTNLTVGSLTSGRIPYASTGGLLVDSANMTFNGTVLTVNTLSLTNALSTANGGTGVTSFTANRVFYASSTSTLNQSANLTFDGTTLVAANFTDSSLTSGRVTYATTGGNLTDSANLLYSGTDLTVYGITVGRGAGAVATNTAVGAAALATAATGIRNTAVGYATMTSNTSGGNNTGVGQQALTLNTTGSDNTAVGYASLFLVTTGGQNTAVGVGSLQNNTASNNTAIGYQAGYSNTTGTATTAIGYQALYAQTTPATGRNTAVGFQSALSLTTGDRNTAVGTFAMNSFTTGSNNTALGEQALYGAASATGTDNVAIGKSAASGMSTGSFNVAVGASSLINNTTGGYNTALGANSLSANTTASDNTAVGWAALFSNTTGTSNVAVGNIALYLTTTGSYNTAVGHQALRFSTTASNNTAVGNLAGYYNTTGYSNSFFGQSAAYSNTTGYENTAVGQGAAYGNTTGYGNVALGLTALNTASTASLNTALGYRAGYSVTTGGLNTFVGQFSGYSMTTGTKNTILGAYNGNQGGLDIRTASNNIVLSDGDGNPRAVWQSAAGSTSNWLVAKSDGDITAYFAPADLAPTATRSARIGFINSSTQKNWFIANNWNVGGSLAFHQTTASGGSTMDATPAAYFDGNGNLRTQSVSVGLAAPGDGYGITFPATQSASSNANTLDDYEEGTWTPTDASGAGLSFTVTGAFYTKVGNLVTCWFELSYPSTSSSASSAIGGLPFASKNVSTYRWSCGAGYNNKSVTDLTLYGSYNSSQFNFYISNGNGVANSSLSNGLLACTFSYQSA